MSSPGNTSNVGQLMPARMMFRCTDGGTADGLFVDAVCATNGQLVGAATNLSSRVVAMTGEAFPTGGSVVLDQGKCLYRGADSSLTSATGSFIIDSVTMIDRSNAGLDLDLYIGLGDVTTWNATWNAAPAAGNYNYLTTFTGGQLVAMIKIRNADYTTQYSGAGTPINKIVTKLVAIPFPLPSSGSKQLQCVVISASTSTATLSQYGLSLAAMIRLGS